MIRFLSRLLKSSVSLLVLSVVLLLAFGILFYADNRVQENLSYLNRLTIDAERILTADLRSTTAVRLAASLESDRYILNYQDFQDTKYALLEEILEFEKSEQVELYFSRMGDVQGEIEDAEADAIALIDEEQWEEALVLVTEPAFGRQKGIYRANLSSALREMILDSEKEAKQAADLYSAMQFGALGTFLLLALIGAVYAREMQRSLRRQSELAQGLKDANERLEERVLQRTAELKESQALFKTVLDHMPAPVFLKDIEGRIKLLNSRYGEVYGVAFDQVAGKRLHDIYAKERADQLAALDRQVIESGKVIETEFVDRIKGEEFTWAQVMFPIFGQNGEVAGCGGIEIDISKRKRAEKELAEKEFQLRAALENMSDGLYVLDRNLNFVLFNQRYLEMAHFLPSGTIELGGPYEKVVRAMAKRGSLGHGDIDELVRQRLAMASDDSFHDVDLVVDDAPLIVSIRKTPMENGGAVMIVTDITDRKIAEKKLADAYAVISSSIKYASRIQRAVLPPSEAIERLCDEHFVIWEPRDVVGGDTYWLEKWGRGTLLVLADCTGHGVPGAFMTLISSGALDHALGEVPAGDPAALLNRLHQIVQAMLGQDGVQGESNDGLELGVCYIDEHNTRLTYSGARFALFVAGSEGVREIRGGRRGIGFREVSRDQTYPSTPVEFQPGQTFYLTTDGLIDQIGGSKRRAFGKRRFLALLESIRDEPMVKQRQTITQSLSDFQGSEARRDDISVIGFRIENQGGGSDARR